MKIYLILLFFIPALSFAQVQSTVVANFKNISASTSGNLELSTDGSFKNSIETNWNKVESRKKSKGPKCRDDGAFAHYGNWKIEKDTLKLTYKTASEKPLKERYLIHDGKLYRININNTILSTPLFKEKMNDLPKDPDKGATRSSY